ncbi:MAG: DUF2207 domain-containing protein [Smithella sp.]|nr:DUF2207 domain-containing protein [Smithella sp.]MDM7988460.1 DUF2207 domain-containing protein [Smithella sp.]HOU50922.1 DUF2207 domain-containing protein [Smithella sp.]HQG66722.1 DUF2207 domain-containing protein [Smithella sp.]HQH17749.1 DUF2207 domain-containing protein [Smithella sp.]
MRKKCFLLLLTLILTLVIFTSFARSEIRQEQERILSFHSDIEVLRSSGMIVTETIEVYAAGNQIKRGIYRDFPTKYKDRYGRNYKVRFDVKEVLRDNAPENFRLQNLSNGVRVYIGNENVLLDPGTYTYVIKYSTNRQLGFFKDFDELYWNVTGNGWSFSIDEASAKVRLPEVPLDKIGEVDAYTGYTGEKGKDFSSTKESDGIYFQTRRSLNPNEGLTIVVQWPKGYVTEPTFFEKAFWYVNDNRGTFAGVIGLLILLFYYLIAWAQYGKDPVKGTIIPLYEPPAKLSPASMRFIVEMGYDDKVFSAAMINMAVKGYLKIQEVNDKFTLIKTSTEEGQLSGEEKAAAGKLFTSSRSEIMIETKNHKEIANARLELHKSLKNSLEKIYFRTNKKLFFVGLTLSFILMISSVIIGISEINPMVIFMIFWLTGWSFGVAILLRLVFSAWKDVFTGGHHKLTSPAKALFITLFSVPFVLGEIAGIAVVVGSGSISILVILGIMIFINALFYQLLKAPTLVGRKVMDGIEGFKMYLSIAEKDRLNLLNPPHRTPELFEKYLPYAFALDVEQEWSEQFSDVLSKAAIMEESNVQRWYSGPSERTFSPSLFSSGLGNSLTSAIASAASPPGSSSGGRGGFSGGGGGGSSGGGGGGGGGGGW